MTFFRSSLFYFCVTYIFLKSYNRVIGQEKKILTMKHFGVFGHINNGYRHGKDCRLKRRLFTDLLITIKFAD